MAVAEAVLRDSYAASHRWYEEFADLLADRRDMLDPPAPHGEVLHDALRQALVDVKEQQRSDRVQTTLQMLWADELLEYQNQMQGDLRASADLFVRGRRRDADLGTSPSSGVALCGCIPRTAGSGRRPRRPPFGWVQSSDSRE